MIKKAGLVLIALVVLVPLTAAARHVDPADPEDTRGLLDVQRIDSMGAKNRPKWEIRTYDRWRAVEIWDVGWGIVHLDTYGDEHFDYYALVSSSGSRLKGALYEDRQGKDDRRIGAVKVDKPDRRSMLVVVDLNDLRRRGNDSWRWYVRTLFTSGRCQEVCIDRAPDANSVQEAEPAPVPTP